MKSLDAVPQKFKHARPSFHLADYAPVALPIYQVTIRALSLTRKPIPPIDEFVLKCIDRGLHSADEISEFLGLSKKVVKNTLISLTQMDNIALIPTPGSRVQSLRLTRKGKTSLQTAESEEPEEREFNLHFDGLIRKAAWYERYEVLRFDELRAQGLIEINAYPPRRPQLPDLEIREIERIVRALGNPDQYRRDLLAIKKIERVQKLFLPATALVYLADDGGEVQVAFLVDNKLSREHELAYARMDGPKKQGIDKVIRSSFAENLEIRTQANELIDRPEELQKVELDAARVSQAVEQVGVKLELSDEDPEKEKLLEELRQLTQEKEKTEAALAEFMFLHIYTYDHPPLLKKALTESASRLMIISPWIKGEVVDADFLKQLEGLLRNGVTVYIGHGIQVEPTKKPKPEDQQAKEQLTHLAHKYKNLCFKRLGNTHAKVLIVDDKFSVISSFNWLSFKGDASRPFRDEQGIKVQDKRFIERQFQELLPRFA
jgi:hypothetical protein